MAMSPESLAAVPAPERPRERMLRLGARALSDAEVLSLILGSGRPGRNVVSAAGDLLAQTGGVAGLLSLDPLEIQRLQGIGPAVAGRLVAAVELGRRAGGPPSGSRLRDSPSIARVAIPELVHLQNERFLVLVADRGLRLRDVVLLRAGSDHRVVVEISEVLQIVLARGCSAFAVAHNHPGGSLQPSNADISITSQLRVAADTVGVRFLDHIIVAGGDWRSIS